MLKLTDEETLPLRGASSRADRYIELTFAVPYFDHCRYKVWDVSADGVVVCPPDKGDWTADITWDAAFGLYRIAYRGGPNCGARIDINIDRLIADLHLPRYPRMSTSEYHRQLVLDTPLLKWCEEHDPHHFSPGNLRESLLMGDEVALWTPAFLAIREAQRHHHDHMKSWKAATGMAHGLFLHTVRLLITDGRDPVSHEGMRLFMTLLKERDLEERFLSDFPPKVRRAS